LRKGSLLNREPLNRLNLIFFMEKPILMDKLHKSEGDINISPRRVQWQDSHLDAESRALLEEDARYFLRQSLSTPCLNTMRACGGI